MLALLSSLLTLAAPAHAYYAILDNAEVMAEGHYKLTGDLQAITDTGGLNAAVRADAGFQEEYGVRGIIGAGVTDFFLGAFFKWMPFPDVKGQPALGFNLGAVFATDDGERTLTFRWEPLVSKKITSATAGTWTPYVSVPLGFKNQMGRDRKNSSDFTAQVVAGTQVQIPKWQSLQFMGEVGVDLDHALSHVALAVVFYLDEENGAKLR